MGVASYFRRGDPGLGYRRLCGGKGGSVRLSSSHLPTSGLDPGLGGFWGSCVSVVMRSVFGSLYVIWALLLGFVCIVLAS